MLAVVHLISATPPALSAGWVPGKTGSEPEQPAPAKAGEAPAKPAEYKAVFIHKLSDFSGPKPYSSSQLKHDPAKGEVYAINGDSVSVFNASGMEIFRIDSDSSIGSIVDIVVASDQKLVMLVNKNSSTRLLQCNYRGEPLGEIALKGLPPELKDFAPSRIYGRDKQFYLVSTAGMRLVVIDEQGAFIQAIDLAKALGYSEQERYDSGIGGFALDRDGGFVIIDSIAGKLYTLASDGKTSKVYGRRGSRPGQFGVPTGVAVDRDGNYLVVDKLRCVVMAFDRNFTFLLEFAKRGLGPGDLIAPDDIVVDNANRAYISNLRKRGVVVYQLSSS